MATKKEYTAAEAQERYDKLPLQIKALLYSPQMHGIIEAVGQKNKLHIDQLGLLEASTGGVMLGFIETQDFSAVLAEDLNIDQTLARTIATDISEQLFTKIRDAMKQDASHPMPAHAPSPAPAASSAVTPPATPQPTAPPPPAQKPADTHPADMMLSQKTVTTAPPPSAAPAAAKPEPPKPQPYKADPYREPAE